MPNCTKPFSTTKMRCDPDCPSNRMEGIEALSEEEKNISYQVIDRALVCNKTKKAFAMKY